MIYACEAAGVGADLFSTIKLRHVRNRDFVSYFISVLSFYLQQQTQKNAKRNAKQVSGVLWHQSENGLRCDLLLPNFYKKNGFNSTLDFHRYDSRGAFPASQAVQGTVPHSEAHQFDSRASFVSDFRNDFSVHNDASRR